RRSVFDLVGEVGVEAEGFWREPAEHADAEPVEDVVLQTTRDEDRALVLVEEREPRTDGDLEASLSIETELAHRRRAGERAGDLNFLCRCGLGRREDAGANA